MKLKKENVVKPIDTFFTRYIGYLGTNRYIPTEQDIYLHVYEEGILIQFIDLKVPPFEIPYTSMIDMRNMSGGDKIDAGRVIGLGLVATPLAITGALWKKHHIITLVQYNDNVSTEPQLIAFDFGDGIQKVQPLIYGKMQKAKTDNN
jgi:hypothetical protein